MVRSTQEISAGRIQQFQHAPPQPPRYDVGYDCEPPPEVRAELRRPKRPQILKPSRVEPKVDRSGVLKWGVAFGLVAIVLAGVVGHYSASQREPAAPQQNVLAIPPAPAFQKRSQVPPAQPGTGVQPPVVAAPTPVAPAPAVVAPTPTVQAPAPVVVPEHSPAPQRPPVEVRRAEPVTRRAELVKLPTPPARAQLVRLPQDLPPLIVGGQYPVRMPYGIDAVAIYRGQLALEGMLPQTGNHLGDMYLVENTPWVWLTVPGTSAPTWVDP